jgi:hypothetical protein
MGVVKMEELVNNHAVLNWVDKWGIHVEWQFYYWFHVHFNYNATK